MEKDPGKFVGSIPEIYLLRCVFSMSLHLGKIEAAIFVLLEKIFYTKHCDG